MPVSTSPFVSLSGWIDTPLINIAAQDREAHVRYCSYFADNVLDRLDDIKRGPGGIREIEFLAQCFQILRGGREPDLQTPSLDRALEEIAVPALMSSEAVVEVRQDYVYLRRLENRIQALRDQQIHRLPPGERLSPADTQESARIFEHKLGACRI